MMKAFATAAICIFMIGSSIRDGRAQISDDVVKIGVLDDMSGLYADIQGPGDVVAVKLAVQDFGGTVNGKTIEVVSGDLQNKADVGSAIARRWYDVEKVDAILGLGNSAVAIAVQGISQEKNRVAITTAAGSTVIDGEVVRATRNSLGLRHLRISDPALDCRTGA
jgi:branched-chain amino acid transport system substrate-binding protein